MSSGWAAVLVAALGLAALALGAVIRLTARWAALELRINALAERAGELLETVREDRAATNVRLTWLERQLYLRGRRYRGGPAEDTDP